VWLREERKTGASPYPSNSITFWEDVTLIIDLIVANLVIPGLLSLWIWKSQGSSLVGTVTCLLTTMSYFIFYWLGDSYKALTIFGLIWMPFIIFASYRLIKKTYGSPVFPHEIGKLATLTIIIMTSFIFIYLNMTALQSTFYKNQKETDHFIFYSSKADYSEVVKLADNLEQHYGRIIGLLKTEPTTKTKVTVFSNQINLVYSLGLFSNFWSLGVFSDEKLFILSPKNRSSILNSSIHEFTHVVLSHIDSKRPTWLEEGVADYLGNTDLNVQKVLPTLVSADKIPNFDEINGPEFVYRNGYPYSYTIVEFLVIKYGYEKLNDFIRHPEEYNRIFGVSKSELHSLWVDYLKANYSH
ncbi:hypothetical protein P9W92_04975, partial [Bacillus cereus]|nr:hypothetical protein [Bacillus cereus]